MKKSYGKMREKHKRKPQYIARIEYEFGCKDEGLTTPASDKGEESLWGNS